MTPKRVEGGTLLLIGTGLIGGSFALAAREHGVFSRIFGADKDPKALDTALSRGVIDGVAPSDRAVDYEAACIAVPLSGIATAVCEAAGVARVVFDVGSVKAPIVDALGPRTPPHYVPCHPIAGSERQGPAAADASLFRNRAVVLTPVPRTADWAREQVATYWRAVGSRVEVQTPAHHDRRFALLSHLPHLVAVAFMEVVGRDGPFDDAGSGFRDFSRIAAGDADVWHDILHGNAEHIRHYLDGLIDVLRTLGAATVTGGAELRQRLEASSALRRTFDGGSLDDSKR